MSEFFNVNLSLNLKIIYLSFIFKPQLNLSLTLQKELHFDVQPLMDHLNMKFAQCSRGAEIILLMNLIIL
jgi:hypothetical protein